MKAFVSQRRGRPKVEQQASDQGTPEIQARRKRLTRGADPAQSIDAARNFDPAQNFDPALGEYPLGLMLARGLASADQHWAGCRYGMLYRLSVGRTQVTYGRLYDALAGSSGENRALDAESLVEARARFLTAKRHLLAAGRAITRAVEDLAVFHAWPRFLGDMSAANDNMKPAARRELMLVRQGLDALLAGFRKSPPRESPPRESPVQR